MLQLDRVQSSHDRRTTPRGKNHRMKDPFAKGSVSDRPDDGDASLYTDGSKLKDRRTSDEHVECDVHFVSNGM